MMKQEDGKIIKEEMQKQECKLYKKYLCDI